MPARAEARGGPRANSGRPPADHSEWADLYLDNALLGQLREQGGHRHTAPLLQQIVSRGLGARLPGADRDLRVKRTHYRVRLAEGQKAALVAEAERQQIKLSQLVEAYLGVYL